MCGTLWLMVNIICTAFSTHKARYGSFIGVMNYGQHPIHNYAAMDSVLHVAMLNSEADPFQLTENM